LASKITFVFVFAFELELGLNARSSLRNSLRREAKLEKFDMKTKF
jgi:hypothetical protein